jgi:hypothetical protein
MNSGKGEEMNGPMVQVALYLLGVWFAAVNGALIFLIVSQGMDHSASVLKKEIVVEMPKELIQRNIVDLEEEDELLQRQIDRLMQYVEEQKGD